MRGEEMFGKVEGHSVCGIRVEVDEAAFGYNQGREGAVYVAKGGGRFFGGVECTKVDWVHVVGR